MDPIEGIAVLDQTDPDSPNLSLVRLRLGAREQRTERLLLRLNTECILQRDGC